MSHTSLASLGIGVSVLDDIERADSLRSYSSMLGMDSALAKLPESYSSMLGMDSALAKLPESYSSMLGMDSALAKLHSSMLGMDSALAKLPESYSSMLGMDSVLAKLPESYSSMLGMDSALAKLHSSMFDMTGVVTSAVGGLSLGHHNSMQETSMSTTLREMYQLGLSDRPSARFGLHRVSLGDYYRTGLDGPVTATTSIPTPAALASGRRGPTAPAKLSIVPNSAPSDPGARLVAAHIDVLVSDGSASEEQPSETAAEFALDLPDHLQILLVSYCFDNHVSVPNLIQQLLAAFFKVEPTPPPPKKERHLKLVK